MTLLAFAISGCSDNSSEEASVKIKTETITVYDKEGNLSDKIEYEYDANGKLILYKYYDNGVDLSETGVYTYTYY